MLPDLARILTPEPRGHGHYTLAVPEGWHQGRGAFGGLVLGGMERAMEQASTQDAQAVRALRSLTGVLCGPVRVGEADISVECLRRGSAVSTWHARLRQGDDVLAVATAVFGKDRPVSIPESARGCLKPPANLDWRSVDIVPISHPTAPDFARFFEYRPTGPWPFSGSEEPLAEGFVRAKTRSPALGAAEVIALADTYWPASLAAESQPRPMATISFTFQLLCDPSTLPPDEPLFHRGRAVAGAAGYMAEQRELWTASGQLVALNPQTFVIIK